MSLIQSPSNPLIKRVRSLRHSKYRSRYGLYVAEGIRLVKEAFDRQAPIEAILFAPDLLTSQLARDLLTSAERRGIPCQPVAPRAFRSLSERDHPQGLLATIHIATDRLEEHAHPPDLILLVHEVQDPGNLGTILRTADAARAMLIASGHAADWYDPKAVRASMGSLFVTPKARVGDLNEALTWCRRHGVHIAATSSHAPRSYLDLDCTPPLMVIVGNEAAGLDESALLEADIAVRIPMYGQADSLNVAVATGILLFEVRRRLLPD